MRNIVIIFLMKYIFFHILIFSDSVFLPNFTSTLIIFGEHFAGSQWIFKFLHTVRRFATAGFMEKKDARYNIHIVLFPGLNSNNLRLNVHCTVYTFSCTCSMFFGNHT